VARDPKAKLHRPVEALRRLQHLSGMVRSVAGDTNKSRAAQLDSVSREMFDVCVAALNGGPLPEPVDHSRMQ
jgi:hypothetical protein